MFLQMWMNAMKACTTALMVASTQMGVSFVPAKWDTNFLKTELPVKVHI